MSKFKKASRTMLQLCKFFFFFAFFPFLANSKWC